jgi:predicted acylesterase/phospholipase RssA
MCKEGIHRIDNIGFYGGGMGVIASVGAYQILQENGILKHAIRIGGSSGGAALAVAAALNCDITLVRKFAVDINHIDYADGPYMDPNNYYSDAQIQNSYHGFGLFKRAYNQIASCVRGLQNLRHFQYRQGLNPGNRLYEYFGEVIEKITGHKDFTFAELQTLHEQDPEKFKQLYLPGLSLNTCRGCYFSHEHTPDMPLRKALVINMAAPYLMQSVEWNGEYYIDGAYALRDPVGLFDLPPYNNSDYAYNPHSHSIRPCHGGITKNEEGNVVSAKELEILRNDYPRTLIKRFKPPTNVMQFQSRVEYGGLNAQDNPRPGDINCLRTSYINVSGSDWKNFRMPMSEKEKLIEIGRTAEIDYYNHYLNVESLKEYKSPRPALQDS